MSSLNVLPKVHKLSEKACKEIENELKGRPIVTDHSWCTYEVSRFIQKELRNIIQMFKCCMMDSGITFTLLESGAKLVSLLRDAPVDFNGSNALITFDFNDLYTNILYDDAKRTLVELIDILEL